MRELDIDCKICMKFFFIITGIIVIGSSILFSYFQYFKDTTQDKVTSDVPVRIATSFWPGSFWVDIAESKGWFKEEGLDVVVFHEDDDYFQSLEDTVAGEYDFNSFSYFDFVSYALAGADITGVIITDHSNGIDAVVVNETIQKARDLDGKKVGYTENSYGDYLFQTALSELDASTSNVTIVNVQPEDTDAFINGEVDAFVTYEPYVTETLALDGSSVLFDTSFIAGLNGGIYTVHNSFLNAHPDKVQKLVNVWHRTTEYIQENQTEAFRLIAEQYNFSEADVAAYAAQDTILGVPENITALSYAANYESVFGSLQSINRHMMQTGSADSMLYMADYIDPTFIRSIAYSHEPVR